MCENGSTRLVLAEVEVACDGVTPRWQQHWYNYDQQGRVTREKYRWPTAGGWSDPLTVAYQYDSAGSLGEVMLPTGNRIIYTRGGSGLSDARRVTSVQYDFGHIGGPINIVTDVSYQPSATPGDPAESGDFWGGSNPYAYVFHDPVNVIDPMGLYGTNDCSYYAQRCKAVEIELPPSAAAGTSDPAGKATSQRCRMVGAGPLIPPRGTTSPCTWSRRGAVVSRRPVA
jgi:hypothetical protein